MSDYCCGPKMKTLKELIAEQPDPVPNKSPAIVDGVIEEFKKRKEIGLARYGVVLQANNGRDALRDAFDEALDLCVYLYQAIQERDNVQK